MLWTLTLCLLSAENRWLELHTLGRTFFLPCVSASSLKSLIKLDVGLWWLNSTWTRLPVNCEKVSDFTLELKSSEEILKVISSLVVDAELCRVCDRVNSCLFCAVDISQSVRIDDKSVESSSMMNFSHFWATFGVCDCDLKQLFRSLKLLAWPGSFRWFALARNRLSATRFKEFHFFPHWSFHCFLRDFNVLWPAAGVWLLWSVVINHEREQQRITRRRS